MLRSVIVLCTAAALVPLTQGCGLFRDPCAKTAAARASASMIVSDASDRIADARRVIDAFSPGVAQEVARKALLAVDQALDDTRKVLAAVDGACTAIDLHAVFAAFADAWHVLEPFLSMLGGPAGSRVATPMAVSL